MSVLLLLANAAYAADDVQDGATAPVPATEATPQHRLLNDKFRISLGGFYAETNTSVRLDANTAVGAAVSFEDLLGLNDRQLAGALNMYWRFGDRWHLGVDYFDISRNGDRYLAKDITWGGKTYTAGTTVSSQSRISDLRTTVGYSAFKRSDKELGFGVGLHATGLKFSLNAYGVDRKSVV